MPGWKRPGIFFNLTGNLRLSPTFNGVGRFHARANAMNRLLQVVVGRLVRVGNLVITDPDGTVDTFGDGSGPPVHVVLRTHHAQRAILLNPWLAVPEAYMEGELDIVEGDVLELLRIVYGNMGPWGPETAWAKALAFFSDRLKR
jgi:cyclopropane-fatty-acyl-phospholipid synthase